MSQTILHKGKMQGSASIPVGAARAGAVRVRNIALPTEHGGWGLTLEPVLLGLIVAPSLAGLFLAMATLAAFLTRHPLKLVMADKRRGRRFLRTPVAVRFTMLYMLIAFLCLLAAIKTASSYEFLLPLLLSTPLALIQLAYDRASRSRTLLPELAGATALSAVASSIALAGGWPRGLAFGLWAILAARCVPTILYVRARLKMLHGKQAATATVLAVHLLALTGVLLLSWARLTNLLAAAALFFLLARALLGLSGYERAASAKQIGIRELGYGMMTIIIVAIGYRFHL